MLYLNTLLTELRNRYVKVPRAFYCTNADYENDHVTLLRTKTSILEIFLKMHYEKTYFIANIDKPQAASDTKAGRFTNTRLSGRFWKEAPK